MKSLILLLVPIVALLGLLDASFITIQELRGVVPACSPQFACEKVLESDWSHIGPIPLSMLGMVFYTTVLLISGALFSGIKTVGFADKKIALFGVLQVLTSIGFAFSLYLLFLMGVVIQGWCLYCLFSAFSSLSLFGLVLLLTWLRKRDGESDFPLRFALLSYTYRFVLKPIFFLFSPEKVHHLMVSVGKTIGRYSWGRWLFGFFFAYANTSLPRTLAGIPFPNPVGLSAGFDWDADLLEVTPAMGFGFETVGTVTYRPYEGNASPRLGRFPDSKSLLVNKGFQSLGAKAVIARMEGTVFANTIGISIGSTNTTYASLDDQVDDIVKCFRLFERSKVRHSYYELNISCPNTVGGQPFTTPLRLGKLLKALELLSIKRPVFVKMPIDLTPEEFLPLLSRLSKSDFIKGVVIGNLTKDHNNPSVTLSDRKKWAKQKGNLSGKPTWHRSNALITLTRAEYKERFVIIGVGGIFTGQDALEKMRCGADAVALITGMIYEGPQLIGEINWTLSHPPQESTS